MVTTRNRWAWIGLVALLVLGGILRVWGMTAVGFWYDEAIAHFYALHDPGWILRHSAGAINHPPGYFLLLRAWLGMGPTYSQAFVDTLSLLFGLATLGVFYRWCRLLFERRLALLATGLLVLHPIHMYYSTENRMYSLALLAVTAAGLFATRLLHGSRARTDWIGLTAASILAVYSHSFTIAYVILLFAGVAWKFHRTREPLGRWARWGIALAVLVLVYAPWGGFVWQQASRVTQEFWIPPFLPERVLILFFWMGGITGFETYWPWFPLRVTGVFLGFWGPIFWSLRRVNRALPGVFWFVLSVPVAVVAGVSIRGQSVWLYRIFLYGLPFAILLWGIGLRDLPTVLGGAAVVLLALLLAWETVLLKRNPPHHDLQRASSWIERRWGTNGPLIVHTDRDLYFTSWFYHGGPDNERVLNGAVAERFAERTIAVHGLRAALARGRDLLLIYPEHNQFLTRKLVEELGGDCLAPHAHGSSTYSAYVLRPDDGSLCAAESR